MTKFHLSDDGNPRTCSARPGNCPQGPTANHFASKEEARAAFENSLIASFRAPAGQEVAWDQDLTPYFIFKYL